MPACSSIPAYTKATIAPSMPLGGSAAGGLVSSPTGWPSFASAWNIAGDDSIVVESSRRTASLVASAVATRLVRESRSLMCSAPSVWMRMRTYHGGRNVGCRCGCIALSATTTALPTTRRHAIDSASALSSKVFHLPSVSR